MLKKLLLLSLLLALIACGSAGAALAAEFSHTAGEACLATYSFTSPGWATFGIVLPRGQAFDALSAGALTTQTDIKNRWPDGSIRYAILTVYIESAGSYEIYGSAPAAGSFAPLIPEALLALNIESNGLNSAEIPYVSVLAETVSADLWLDGPLVKEWRVRDIPKNNGMEHPFLSNIWDVRIYSDGTGTVDVTVENVRDVAEADAVIYSVDIFLNDNNVYRHEKSKPGPNPIVSNEKWSDYARDYTSVANDLAKGNYVRITSGPSTGQIAIVSGDPQNDRFDFYPMYPDPWEQYGETWEHVLYHQYGARWRRVFSVNDFLKAEVRTDFTPFIAAKAVPAYLPDIRTGLTAWGRGVWEGTDILGFSIMMPSIGAGGHWPERGLYPEWAANYIAHGTQELKALTLDLGELSGSYALHYTKDDPASIVTLDENPFYMFFENAFLGDKPKNNMRGAGVRFKNSHGQSMAYIPYLVAGDRYFSDEMMFHADFAIMSTYAYTYDTYFPRNGTDGLLWLNEMRGVAWALRDVADAAHYLPDDSPYKLYFTNIMNKNLETFDEYMLNLNSPLGFVGFGNYFDQGGAFGAPWQYAYLAWSLDRAIEQNETAAGSLMRNRLLNTLLEPITGALGFPPEYTPGYWIRYGDGSNALNLQYYSTWKQVFDANYRDGQGAAQPPPWWAEGYAPEMRLAMILAKKAGLSGAKEAYDYVMTMDDGTPGLLMRGLLNNASAYAIADVEMADPVKELDSEVVSLTVKGNAYTGAPITLLTDEVFPLSAIMKNTGTAAWGQYLEDGERGASFLSRGPDYNETFGTFFISPGQSQRVAPGATFNYNTLLCAPAEPGEYTMTWQLADWIIPYAYIPDMHYTTRPFYGETVTVKLSVAARTDQPPVKPRVPGVLDALDFEYEGSFSLPGVPGLPQGHWDEKAFFNSGITLRTAGGEKRMLLTTGTYNQSLYEVAIPEPGKFIGNDFSAVPIAELRTVFGELPRNTGEIYEDQAANGSHWYDGENGLLYWTNWHSFYNPPSIGFPALRSARLEGGVLTEVQQWYQPADIGGAPLKSFWGGVTQIPGSFAEQYTGGRTLALGFGGGYAINATTSFGPALAAASVDPNIGGTMDMQTIMYYTIGGVRCERDGNYFAFNDPLPADPWNGRWTQGDTVRTGVFIDLPDKKGYVTFARQVVGRLGYDYGGANWNGKNQNVWYFYDFDTLGAAATGMLPQDGLTPSSFSVVEYPHDLTKDGQYVGGSCFDPETRRLYLYTMRALQRPGDYYTDPVVHVYKINEGFTVSGLVKSYDPQHETTLELWREGEAEAACTTFIRATESGSGQREQPFTFTGVEPGVYTLVITKAAHTSFTVRNIVVEAEDVDLTADGRPEVQLMTLRCGDINGDGNINNSDLTILWQQANYNRSAAAAANGLCDLNGDGLINNIDLTILWLAYNYNRGAVIIE